MKNKMTCSPCTKVGPLAVKHCAYAACSHCCYAGPRLIWALAYGVPAGPSCHPTSAVHLEGS